MLDRVLAYVRSVLAGEVKGDAAVGRYLLNTFGASTEELEKGAFHTSLQASQHFNNSQKQRLTFSIGHTYGIIPCESRSITSRSLFPFGPHTSIVEVQKSMYYTLPLLYLVDVLFRPPIILPVWFISC